MKSSPILFTLGLVAASSCDRVEPPPPIVAARPAPPAPVPAPPRSRVVTLPASGDFEVLVRAEVERARADGLRPYLEFTADWCPPCAAFKQYLHDPLMEDALAGTCIVSADADQWGTAMTALGVTGIPTWIELDPSGRATGRSINSGIWGEDIPTNMAPPLKAFFAARPER